MADRKKAKHTGITASETEAFEKALAKKSTTTYVFRLFVTGITPRSLEAIESVLKLCDRHLKGRYQLEVIDVYQNPRSAREEQVIAAPTLVKKLPLPIKKFVGAMTRYERVLAGLEIREKEVEE